MVSAAAGSGKTAVLVERIIEKISSKEEPVDVDRLLVVTYTHAAANEMKERIRRAIEKKVEEDPENEHLIRQLSLIHKAQITTIHSFCLNLIRDYYYKLDLDPNFAIGDQGQMDLMKLEVLDDVLEEHTPNRAMLSWNLSKAIFRGKTMTGSETMSWGSMRVPEVISIRFSGFHRQDRDFRSVRRKNFTGQSG